MGAPTWSEYPHETALRLKREAAEALYDALSTAVEALESFRTGSDYYPDFPAWEADARAALALARGETPSDTLGEKA